MEDQALAELLCHGELRIVGRMPYSSNATLLVEACAGDHSALGVYKPARGERPLWDFPAGLHRREVAAYELARALGWDLVPVTVLRTEGPLGEGSVQAFVDAAFEEHYFTIHERGEHHETLQKLCLFDLVANATDRKGGHVLIDEDDHVWAIDNGLSFHAEFKLRTVIWDYAGEPVPAELCAAVRRFAGEPLPEALADLLDPFERDALVGRATAVAELDCFPTDSTGRRHPWPLV